MFKLIKKLKSKDGYSDFTGTPVFIILFCLLFLAFVYLMPFFKKYFDISVFAKQVARRCEIAGSISIEPDILALKQKYNLLDVSDISITANTYSGDKVQLNNDITVIVNYDYYYKIASVNIKMPIKIIAQGKSEVYYK